MTERATVIIALPGLGTLALDREVFEQSLAAGAALNSAAAGRSAVLDEPLMSSEQLSEVLGVPASWLEQAARENRIPCLEFGRWRRFKRGDVEAAVRSVRAGKLV
jgi:excisionase family DNA binding protein